MTKIIIQYEIERFMGPINTIVKLLFIGLRVDSIPITVWADNKPGVRMPMIRFKSAINRALRTKLLVPYAYHRHNITVTETKDEPRVLIVFGLVRFSLV